MKRFLAVAVVIAGAFNAHGYGCNDVNFNFRLRIRTECGDVGAACRPGVPIEFAALIRPGINETRVPVPECGDLEWTWGDGSPIETIHNYQAWHAFPAAGWYDGRVTFRAPNGWTETLGGFRIHIAEAVFAVDEFATVGEGTASVPVIIRRDRADIPGTVDYRTTNGAVTGTAAFAVGEWEKSVTIPLPRLNDDVYTGDSSVYVQISNPSAGHEISPDQATERIIIVEDDVPWGFRILYPMTIRVREGTTVEIPVERIGPDDTKSIGVYTEYPYGDYLQVVPRPEGVGFGPGQRKSMLRISAGRDGRYTGTRRGMLWATAERPYENYLPMFGQAMVYVHVLEGDPPTMSIGDASVREGNETPNTAEVNVWLAGIPDAPVTATWSTADETAKAGEDYVASTGAVLFLPGQYKRTISIPLIGDRTYEPAESFQVSVVSSQPMTKSLGTVTIVDDDVKLAPENMPLAKGARGTLELLLPRAANGAESIAVSSSNPAHAAVPASVTPPSGATVAAIEVRGDAPGAATITVSAPSFEAVDQRAVVHVFAPTALTASPQPLTLLERTFGTIRVTATPAPGEPIPASVSVGDPAILRAPATMLIPPDGELTFDVEALAPGASSVTISLSSLYGNASAAVRAEVSERILPSIEAVEPASGLTAGGTSVRVTGKALDASCVVTFGDAAATATAVDGGLVVVTPPHVAGAVDVSVTCSTGSSTLPRCFNYVNPRSRAVKR